MHFYFTTHTFDPFLTKMNSEKEGSLTLKLNKVDSRIGNFYQNRKGKNIKIVLYRALFLWVKLRVSNRNSVARNYTQLFSNCTQFLGFYRARNCAQVKFTCVGNPS